MKKTPQQIYESTGHILATMRDGGIVTLYPQSGGVTLKFSGQVTKSEGGGTDTFYLADTGAANVVPPNSPVTYVAAQTFATSTMYVGLSNGADLTGGQSIVVKLIRNGSPVASASVTFAGSLSLASPQISHATFAQNFSAGETYDVQVLVTAGTNSDGWTLSVNVC